jgi:hypothetical protein
VSLGTVRGYGEVDLGSAVGALEWFVKGRESGAFLGFLLPTDDVDGGIWRAKNEIARSDTRAEWWVHSV